MVDHNFGIINSGTIGGDAKVKSVVTHTGDNVELQAPAQIGINELVDRLQAALLTVPDSHRDGAAAIARQAELLAEAASAKTPNKTFIQITGEALKATAKFVADVAPSVAPIISAIVSAAAAL